jgi:hypothetical protein
MLKMGSALERLSLLLLLFCYFEGVVAEEGISEVDGNAAQGLVRIVS